jgi:mannan endo-1,4-beta-mannosidase
LLNAFSAALLLVPLAASAGFKVQNGRLVDNNGTAFVMRGVNYPYGWYTSRASWGGTQQDIANIAGTKANTIRFVLGSGAVYTRTSGSEVANLIQWSKNQKIVSVLEVHDSTGWGDASNAAHINNSAYYWLSSDVKSAIQGQENYVIINIANEPFGNNTSGSFVNDTINAIKILRNAGLTHTIMVDAANWGQDWSGTTRNAASTIFNGDPLKNTIISVHMYEVYQNSSAVSNYMQAYQNAGVPLVVGEFGQDHQGSDVDEQSIMYEARQRGIGYIGWSWSGNGSCCTSLDIVSNFSTSLTSWGSNLVNSTNGIKNTSQPASVFGGSNGGGNTCNWQGSTYPFCQNDNIGWGWENNASCISNNLCATQTGGQCNWSGTFYPTCSTDNGGWGWENNQSCASRSMCATQQ